MGKPLLDDRALVAACVHRLLSIIKFDSLRRQKLHTCSASDSSPRNPNPKYQSAACERLQLEVNQGGMRSTHTCDRRHILLDSS